MPEEKYYLRVTSASTGLNSTGAFAVVATFDELLSAESQDDTDRVVRTAFHWWGLDEKSINDLAIAVLFGEDDADDLNDDDHTDDDANNAVDLEPISQTSSLVRYLAIGSLADAVDNDYYQVRSADLPRSQQVLTVFVDSLKSNGLIPAVQIMDESGSAVVAKVIVNGSGQYVVRATGIRPDNDYLVRVLSGNSSIDHQVGSYSVSMTFDASPFETTTFASGTIDSAAPVQEFKLYVAKTQLISLSLSSTTAVVVDNSQLAIWAAVYDDQQKPVNVLAAQAGNVRSAVSVLLTPGEYTLQVAAKTLDGSDLPAIEFSLQGTVISDPIGPPAVDPNVTPIYSCPETTGAFCYPGDIASSDPFVVVPEPEPTLPSAEDAPFTPPVDWWFWNQEFGRTNPVNPYDVNNDSITSSLDVLAVIVDLVKRGTRAVPPPPLPSQFLDVNGDGLISPRDALAILASMTQASAGAEGESQAAAQSDAAPFALPPLEVATKRRRAFADGQ